NSFKLVAMARTGRYVSVRFFPSEIHVVPVRSVRCEQGVLACSRSTALNQHHNKSGFCMRLSRFSYLSAFVGSLALSFASPSMAQDVSVERGERVFQNFCVRCHL